MSVVHKEAFIQGNKAACGVEIVPAQANRWETVTCLDCIKAEITRLEAGEYMARRQAAVAERIIDSSGSRKLNAAYAKALLEMRENEKYAKARARRWPWVWDSPLNSPLFSAPDSAGCAAAGAAKGGE